MGGNCNYAVKKKKKKKKEKKKINRNRKYTVLPEQ